MQTMEEVYYTPKEIAERFKMSEAAIRKFIRDGKLKAIRMGVTYRIADTALEEFLHKSQVKEEDKPENK